MRNTMRLALACGLLAGPACAEDEIDRKDADGKVAKLRGKIVSESPRRVAIAAKEGGIDVPLGEIVELRYHNQPSAEISRAKAAYESGNYEEAVREAATVVDILEANTNANLKGAALFALVRAKVGLAKADPATADDAAATAARFAKEYPGSRHEYAFQQAFGELCLSRGEYDQAAKSFALLKDCETPGMRERAIALEGLALLEKGDAVGAVRNFDEAISAARTVPEAKGEALAARIFKAEAALRGNPDAAKLAAAEKQLREALKDAAAEDKLAKAYGHNALGDALRLQKKPPKEALLQGYLWVATLYSDDVQQLARALYHSQALFAEIGQRDRAEERANQLRTRFPNTKWAKQLPAAAKP